MISSYLVCIEIPKKQMLREAVPLERYLTARKVPVEKKEFLDKRLEVKNEVKNTCNYYCIKMNLI